MYLPNRINRIIVLKYWVNKLWQARFAVWFFEYRVELENKHTTSRSLNNQEDKNYVWDILIPHTWQEYGFFHLELQTLIAMNIRVKRVHATRTMVTKAFSSPFWWVVIEFVVAKEPISSLENPCTMAGFPDTSSNRTTPNEYTSTIGDTSPNRAYLESKH